MEYIHVQQIMWPFCQCFLQDEQVQAVVGASGGGMIIAGTAEVLLNHFARGMDPLSSVMAPRVYHQVFMNIPTLSEYNLQFSLAV